MIKNNARSKTSTIITIVVLAIIVALIYVLAFTGVFSSNLMRILLNMCLYASFAVMWNLMAGYAGLTSLGNQAFIGLAGYACAVMCTTYGFGIWVAMLVGGLVCAVLAVILAFALMRMRGMYFAVATWVAAEALKTAFQNWKFVKEGAGMTVKIKPYPSNVEIFALAFGCFIVCMVVVYLLLKSKTGLGLKAMRDDADAASSIGVNIFASRLLCYVICGFLTGVAGVIMYISKGSIFPGGGFAIDWTIKIVFIVIIGGIGTAAGPVLGAIIYTLLYEILAQFAGFTNIVLGIVAIVVIVALPKGIIGALENKFKFEILSQRRKSLE